MRIAETLLGLQGGDTVLTQQFVFVFGLPFELGQSAPNSPTLPPSHLQRALNEGDELSVGSKSESLPEYILEIYNCQQTVSSQGECRPQVRYSEQIYYERLFDR